MSQNPVRSKGPFVYTGSTVADPKVAFVYTGQGSQWWAMARELIVSNDTFSNVVDAFDQRFQEYSGWLIKSEFRS